MDFDKLLQQRAAKDKATGEQTEAPASKKLAPQGRGISKRQGWKAATFYLKPETLAQLRRVVLERKLEGSTGDLSDAVEEALEAWLSQQGKQPPKRQGGKASNR
jgi:hypothetical protein